MLLITDSFYIKSNLQKPLKNVSSVRDLGLENIFSIIIETLLMSTFFFNSDIWRYFFSVFIMDCLN